jgi:hypothetical protein
MKNSEHMQSWQSKAMRFNINDLHSRAWAEVCYALLNALLCTLKCFVMHCLPDLH